MAKVRVGSIVLRVDNLWRQTEFWAAVLDYVPREEQSDDFALLRPRDGVGPSLSLDQVHSQVHVPPRIHLDLYTDDQVGEVKRLIALVPPRCIGASDRRTLTTLSSPILRATASASWTRTGSRLAPCAQSSSAAMQP